MHTHTKYIIVIAILSVGMLIYTPAFAQIQDDNFTFKLHHWTTEDGLPEWNILSFFEDKKGQLWFGTDKSLISFDGYEFKVRYSTSESETVILRPQEDNEGSIWFLERNRNEQFRLLCYNPYTNNLFSFNDLPNVNKNDFYRVLIQDETFLIFNQKGEFFNKNGQRKFSLPFHAEHLHFCFLSGDNIWVVEEEPLSKSKISASRDDAPNYHIYLYNRKNQTIHYTDTIIANDFVYSFWEENGHLYSLKQPRIAVEKLASLNYTQYSINGKKNFSLAQANFKIQHRNTQYIGWVEQLQAVYFQKQLLVRRVQENIRFYHNGRMLSLKNTPIELLETPNVVNRFFIDQSGDCWMSSLNGLYKIEIQKNAFHKYLHKPLFYYSTRGMFVDTDGNLQIHTYKGTQRVDLKTSKTELHRVKVDSRYNYYPNGVAFCKGEAGLWMGQHGAFGIHLYDGKKAILYPFYPAQSQQIYNIQPAGRQVWIGTANGIFRVDKSEKQLVAVYNENVAIRYLYENPKGVWAATDKGLYLFNKKGKLQQRFLENFSNEQILIKHFFEDEDGTFWLATTNGLIHWHPKKNEILSHFTTKDGLSHNNIHSVYGDKTGFLWMSSDNGLMRLNKASNKIKTYLEEDGIAHHEFNTGSHYQAADGQLFFGGISGVTAFYPKKVIAESSGNLLYPYIVTGEITNGKSGKIQPFQTNINLDKKLTLSPTENFVTIELTAFLLEKNPNVEYSWQIGDQQPVIQKERTIRINNVAYGQQILKIKVREVGQDWSENTLTVSIYRARPFYMQWWFIGLVVALVVFGVWQYFQNRTRKLEKEKEKLSVLVKERTAQIQEDKETIEEQATQLKKLNQSQRQFFTNITHELRTPLTLVIGPLQQKLNEKLSKKEQSQVKMMLKNAQHLQILINQLLDLSKLESGQMKVEVAHGDLSAFTYEIVTHFQTLATAKKQSLVFQSSETPFKTHFDKNKWRKIIYNLVSNAIKFTPNGGSIQVKLTRSNDNIHLTVKDTGVGIEENNLKNIFNRFYQIDGSTKRTQEGTGIGLALVKELVELQSGQISVNSEIKKGTTFEIMIPMVTQPIVSNLQETLIPMVEVLEFDNAKTGILIENNDTNTALNILIIEDNSDMRYFIKSCLAPFNYRIETAIDGVDGIEKALANPPDLIISDVMMPRKDGYEVISTIRQNTATSHIPIILLTAKASLESRLIGIDRGADVYFTKPFSPKELSLRIRKLIELRQLMQLRYQNGLQSLTAQTVPTLKKEDEFIQNLQQLILDNLNNEGMNNDWLARHYHINRTQFYRKVKTLTGHTVAKFVNIIKLQEAERLMKLGNDNLATISYKVGFSSPSQFSKVSKRILGKSPSERMNSAK